MEIKTFVSSNMGENCYAVKVGSERFVVDPGEFSPELQNYAAENKDSIKYILLTHCHFDHVMGVKALKEICKSASIVAFAGEVEGLGSPSINLSTYFGLPPINITPDLTVNDGDKLKIAGREIEVLHTPGHTKGSVCYLIDKTLFSGDTLFKGSFGRTDLPTSSTAELISSLKRLKALDEDILVLSGHGEKTTIGKER